MFTNYAKRRYSAKQKCISILTITSIDPLEQYIHKTIQTINKIKSEIPFCLVSKMFDIDKSNIAFM